VRQLLNCTSGLKPGFKALRTEGAGDRYAYAVNEIPTMAKPGEVFAYGPSHFTVFGALLARKLRAAEMDPDPLAYLKQRVFDPIGLQVARWPRDRAGNPIMPGGASLSAREWAKFGRLVAQMGRWDGRVLIRPDLMQALLQGSGPNPGYGLSFWLNSAAGSGPSVITRLTEGERAVLHRRREDIRDDGFIFEEGPRDLVMAAGARQQRLYIIPSRQLVIVRQGEKQAKDWSDKALLSLILGSSPERR
jgi:CubicO group peptidase (beta-lactamase class C family)